ncbi:unnamed protein product [Discula destructiva]
MFEDGEFQMGAFGSDILDSDGQLPPPTTTTTTTTASTGSGIGSYVMAPGVCPCNGNGTRILESLLFKMDYLEKEVSRLVCHERRFDQLDKELAKQNRFEKMERDMQKMTQNVSNLQAELKSFAVDLTSRIKQVEVYPAQEGA